MAARSITALPAAVKRFFEAFNRHDTVATVGCFMRDATVENQFGQFVGRSAIEKWLAETNRKYRPMFCLLREISTDADVGIVVSISGEFPGSPAQLDFHFRIRGGEIAALTIEP